MKKLLTLLLAMLMIFSLAACGENNTTDPDKDNPGVSQSGENNDSQGGENNDKNSIDDKDQGGNTGGTTVADANEWLTEHGFEGFTFPEDLAVDQISLRDMPAAVLAVFCPVDNAKYEEVLQAMFSNESMDAKTVGGKVGTSLDDYLSTFSTDDMTEHLFNFESESWMYSVTVDYFHTDFNNGSVAYDAQTLCISINCVQK